MKQHKHNDELYVPIHFREFIQNRYSVNREDFWRLIQYMLYSNMRDNDDPDRLVVSYKFIRNIAPSYTSAYDFLKAFEIQTGINLNISDYNSNLGFARTIKPELDSEFIELISNTCLYTKNLDDKTNLVCLATGEPWKLRKMNELKTNYLKTVVNCEFPEQHPLYPIVEELHTKSVVIRLTKIVNQNALKTQMAIAQIKDENRRCYASRIFYYIQQYPAIQYAPCEKTTRINPLHANILALPREIRKVILSGLWSVDLKSAQLSIIAKTWELPLVSEFFATNKQSFWNYILDYLDIHEPEKRCECKDYIKTLCYSIAYGMGNRKLFTFAREHFGEKLASRLMANPIMREIRQQRKHQAELIKQNKGAFDFFGNWLTYEQYSKSKSNVGSILSRVAQSYESALMLKVFEYINIFKSQIKLISEVIKMKEVYDFLKKCGTYYLATVDGDQPRVRPFGTIDIFEDKLYIQTGKVKDVSKQMGVNPKIEICGTLDGKWIRIQAEAVEDERI
jgi:hypothetical protein